jgi:hypothetical protein
MIHDRVTSVLNLARVELGKIDPKTTHTSVQNETLRLMLNTLIELGTPQQHHKIEAEAKKTVEGMIVPPILDERPGGAGGWI